MKSVNYLWIGYQGHVNGLSYFLTDELSLKEINTNTELCLQRNELFLKRIFFFAIKWTFISNGWTISKTDNFSVRKWIQLKHYKHRAEIHIFSCSSFWRLNNNWRNHQENWWTISKTGELSLKWMNLFCKQMKLIANRWTISKKDEWTFIANW